MFAGCELGEVTMERCLLGMVELDMPISIAVVVIKPLDQDRCLNIFGYCGREVIEQ